MSITPEGKVKKQVKALLAEFGAYYNMPVTGGFGKQGGLDFNCCVNGYFLAIETKAGNNKLTPLQLAAIDQIRAAGGVAVCINEDLIPYLRGLLIGIKSRRASP